MGFRTTYEERLIRSSLQVSGWVLHDLPSVSGCLASAVNLQVKHITIAAPPSGKRDSLRQKFQNLRHVCGFGKPCRLPRLSLPQEPGRTRICRSEDPYAVLAGNDDQAEAEQSGQKLIDHLPWQIDLLLEIAFCDPARPGLHDEPH